MKTRNAARFKLTGTIFYQNTTKIHMSFNLFSVDVQAIKNINSVVFVLEIKALKIHPKQIATNEDMRFQLA